MPTALSDFRVEFCEHGQPRGRSGDLMYICGICDAGVIAERDAMTCRHGNLHGTVGNETFICSWCERPTGTNSAPLAPGQLTHEEVTGLIIDEIRALVGGPKSLKYRPHVLIKGLAKFSGNLIALTFRTVDELAPLIERAYDKAPVVSLGVDAKINPGSDEAEMALALGGWLAIPADYKKPSHLILTATLSVLAQAGKATGTPLTELLTLLKAEHAQVTPKLVNEFQRLAAATRSN